MEGFGVKFTHQGSAELKQGCQSGPHSGSSHHDHCFSALLGLGPTEVWGQAWAEAGPVGSSPARLGEIPALLHAPHLPLWGCS